MKLVSDPPHHLDLIILDLNVPKLDGHDFLSRRPAHNAPVVVFSSSLNSADKEWALANGAKDYVVKPHEFSAFLEAVASIVERWSLPEDSGDAER